LSGSRSSAQGPLLGAPTVGVLYRRQ
jgi:hypothetical protein